MIGCLLRLLALILSCVGWIVVIFMSFWLIKAYGDLEARDVMHEVNGMTFGSGKNQLTAYVTHPLIPNEEGYYDETEALKLTIKNPQGNTAFEKGLLINHDMFGSGFLRAMQVDDDPELEIVFCIRGFQSKSQRFSEEYFANNDPVSYSFYLDINSGQVKVRDFMTTPQKVRDIAESRLSTLNPLGYVILEILASPVLIILGYMFWMRRFNKRWKKDPLHQPANS